jgi:hypothetical protein
MYLTLCEVLQGQTLVVRATEPMAAHFIDGEILTQSQRSDQL